MSKKTIKLKDVRPNPLPYKFEKIKLEYCRFSNEYTDDEYMDDFTLDLLAQNKGKKFPVAVDEQQFNLKKLELGVYIRGFVMNSKIFLNTHFLVLATVYEFPEFRFADEDAFDDLIIDLKHEFSLATEIGFQDKINKKEINAFIRNKSLSHIWPFAREYVIDTFQRAGYTVSQFPIETSFIKIDDEMCDISYHEEKK